MRSVRPWSTLFFCYQLLLLPLGLLAKVDILAAITTVHTMSGRITPAFCIRVPVLTRLWIRQREALSPCHGHGAHL